MAYSKQDRIRIHLRGKLKAGMIKRDAAGKFDYMQQCISEMTDAGEDADDARDICEVMWGDEE